ncbi:MAG: hypothetical protein AAF191_18760, partial [Verrucomicrobiota bacterium]
MPTPLDAFDEEAFADLSEEGMTIFGPDDDAPYLAGAGPIETVDFSPTLHGDGIPNWKKNATAESAPADALLPVDGGEDLFAGFSEEILVPEMPYLFAQSIYVSQGYRTDDLETGFGEETADLYSTQVSGDFHFGRITFLPTLEVGTGDDFQTFDFTSAVGYTFDLTVTGIQLTPLAGYAFHHQDHDDLLDFEWSGPFLGAQLDVPLRERWDLRFTYLHHWADLEASLVSPLSLTQDLEGDGNEVTLRILR